jgi:glycerol 3-phosphatase-2
VLAAPYDAILLDLDGVLYRWPEPIPGAAEAVVTLRDAGKRVAFVTNNASRTPEEVAERLASVGVRAEPRRS